jgi:hypothetical protein
LNIDKYRANAARLVRNPDDPDALVDQFACISEVRKNSRQYLPLARRAYELAPDQISCVFNYGSALHRVGEFEKARDIYLHCLKLADDGWMPKVLHHCGIAYRALGEGRKAAEYYTRAYEVDPNPQYLKDRSIAILSQGKFNEGLREFEVRREVSLRKMHENKGNLISQDKLPDGVVHWQGEDLTGKTVVVYHEEGRSYFKAEPAKIPQRGKLNVGLVWRGNPAYGQDVHRSMPFSEFCPLFDIPGAAFYSLQAGPASLEVTNLGLDGFVANLEPLAKSWRDTARLIQALDVVVTVDTAVAHLAGALGKPVFILVTNASDWRWNRNSRKTVWYDSATVIRQKKQDDWAPCIKAVREELQGMMNVRRKAA